MSVEKAWSIDAPVILERLDSSTVGLSQVEAERRLEKYGRNEIRRRETRTGPLILLSQFKNPLVLLLIFASVVTMFVGELTDALIITCIVLLNGALGFYQEYRSERALEELNRHIRFLAQVRRDGEMKSVDTGELVPGDVVLVGMGDVVPADLRLLSLDELSVDEAPLTGESFPVSKAAQRIEAEEPSIHEMMNLAFMGTYVKSGRGEGVVVATAENTYLGKTAQILGGIQRESEFQRNMARFGLTLVKVVLASVAILFAINTILGKDIFDTVLFSLALAVGMVPVALPIVVTISLSSGALMLSKEKVLVKRLVSVEDLGNVDVICTDKTGTITENRITLEEYMDVDGNKDGQILQRALICNPLRNDDQPGNPIDKAIWSYTRGWQGSNVVEDYALLKEIPFNSNNKRNSVVVESEKERLLIVKGAPEVILEMSTHVSRKGLVEPLVDRDAVIKPYQDYAGRGYRVIAVAERHIEGKEFYTEDDEAGLTLLGYVAFMDPPKETARVAFELSREMHIEVKILTGDGPYVSKEIARQVGLEIRDEEIVLGQELDKLTDDELQQSVGRIHIVSRATPEHKYRVIKALNKTGRVTACIGDGVNDAPALKEADVSIAVDQGTDIAKDAADIVLLEKDLKVIMDGIREDRRTFNNIVKYILYTIAGNFGDLYTVGIASTVMHFLPLLPSQLILANFLTDTPVVAVSTDNVEREELVRPRRWDINHIFKFSGILGAVSAFFDALLIVLLLNVFGVVDPTSFRTALFLEIVLSEILVLFMIRSDKFFLRAEHPSGKLMLASLFAILIILAIIYLPFNAFFDFSAMPVGVLAVVGMVTVGYIAATEVVKLAYFKRLIRPRLSFLHNNDNRHLAAEREFIRRRTRANR